MTRGNFSYVHLLHGGTSAEFVRLRDANALGADPVASYIKSAQDYAGLAETPIAAETTHRFFAAPEPAVAFSGSRQDRLLHRMGRNPGCGH